MSIKIIITYYTLHRFQADGNLEKTGQNENKKVAIIKIDREQFTIFK